MQIPDFGFFTLQESALKFADSDLWLLLKNKLDSVFPECELRMLLLVSELLFQLEDVSRLSYWMNKEKLFTQQLPKAFLKIVTHSDQTLSFQHYLVMILQFLVLYIKRGHTFLLRYLFFFNLVKIHCNQKYMPYFGIAIEIKFYIFQRN